MSIIAQQLGRTVYYMLKRKEAFNPDKFYGDKKIENKDSGGEHLAYVASRRLHEKKLSASYDDHLIFDSGLARVPVHLHAGAFAFLADAASLASFSPKMSSCRKSVFSGLP